MIASLLIAGTIAAQTVTEKMAKEILGDNFISLDEALAIWKKIDSSITRPKNIVIPYSEKELKEYASKNKNDQGQYFLIPNLGLRKEALEKFWHFDSPINESETVASYRLINLAAANEATNSWRGYKMQIDSLAEVSETIIPLLDYVEIIATASIARNQKFSSQLKVFFINDLVDEKNMTIFSTLMTDTINEIVIMKFPKENFMTGYINRRYAYYFIGENLDKLVYYPLEIYGLKLGKENEFFLATSSAVQP